MLPAASVMLLVAVALQLVEFGTAETFRVSNLPCNQQGKQLSVPTVRVQGSPHNFLVRIKGRCLCAPAYRFQIKVPSAQRTDGSAKLRVCATNVRLFADRMVLKRINLQTGQRKNIMQLGGSGHIQSTCRNVKLLRKDYLELRLKIQSPCARQVSSRGPRLNVIVSLVKNADSVTSASCQKPTGFVNGIVHPTNQTQFRVGEFVYHECAANYSLVESNHWFSKCRQSGQWHPSTLPRCAAEADWCPPLTISTPHATLVHPDERSVGSVARVSCDEGYHLHGLPHYICQKDGTWSSRERLDRVACLEEPNCPLPEGDNVIIVGSGIYPNGFSKHCCRPGLEQYDCGVGRTCDACKQRYCTVPHSDEDDSRAGDSAAGVLRPMPSWTDRPPKCRAVQSLWTRLYSSLFQAAREMNASIESSTRQCGGHDPRQGAEGTGGEGAENTNSERNGGQTGDGDNNDNINGKKRVARPRELPCSISSRSIQDLRGCFDLAFLLDTSLSISDHTFYNTTLPFVRVVSNYFSIGRNRTWVSVLLFQENSKFILKQEKKSKAVYAALSRVKRPRSGNTNLRYGMQRFASEVALDLYNGSTSARRQCQKVMFVLSDGAINDGGSPEQAAGALKELDWSIYAIGIGSQAFSNRIFGSIASKPLYEYRFILDYEPDQFRCGRQFCPPPPSTMRRQKKQQSIEEFVSQVIPVKADYSQCGRSGTSIVYGRAKILGGKEARFGRYPWQVAILDKDTGKVFCSGTLICKDGCKWVLTAAHCFWQNGPGGHRRHKSQVLLRFGENDLTVLEGSELECGVQLIAQHQSYSGYPEHGNDIAMVLPDCDFDLNSKRRCACLPDSSDTAMLDQNRPVEIAGWGSQKPDGSIHAQSHVLQWLKMRVVGRDQCSTHSTVRLRDTVICAKGEVAGTDSCRGDSGGALMARRADDSYVALAIVSYGQIDDEQPDVLCGLPDYYGVYTRVYSFIKWIEQTFQIVLGC